MNKKILIAALIFILIGVTAYLLPFNLNKNENIGCTADAMICPDGSAVGRVPPSCEFSPCPTTIPQP